eukprot:Gb_27337 [translate_table: standard]
MEVFDQWKAAWCIGSVFPAPQLITGPSAEILGPLLFDRVGDPLSLLPTGCKLDRFVDTCSSPNIQVQGFLGGFRESFVPYDVLNQCVAEDMYKKLSTYFNSNQILGNCLQGLKCRDGTMQFFFPVGANMDQIGSIVCSNAEMGSSNNCKQLPSLHGINVLKRKSFTISLSLHHPIIQLAAVGRDPLITHECIEGFLLARTSYAVHWFRAETREGFPTLNHLATANFKKGVSYVCWNPHLPEESAVILENGELRLFDLSACRETSNCPVKLIGKSLCTKPAEVTCSRNNVSKERVARKKFWQGLSEFDFQNIEDCKETWWHCEYAWHPRTLLVAGWDEVRLVDFRAKKEQTSAYSCVLAKSSSPEAFSYCSCPSRRDRFVAFARADYDMFRFTVATKQHVLLFDTRQPLTPIIQWEHGLKQSPGYLHMCRLSELRPSLGNRFKWASDSGHAILAVSFRSGDMRVFCYGPRPSVDQNVCGTRKHKIPFADDLGFPDVLYAWELPSKIFTVNSNCYGDYTNDLNIYDDSCSADFLYPKFGKSYVNAQPENICGLCIISDQPTPRTSTDSMEGSEERAVLGFSLVQLTGRGKLILQKYQASRKLTDKKHSSAFVTSSAYANFDIMKNTGYTYKKLPSFERYLKTGSILHGVLPSSSGICLEKCKLNGRVLLKSSGWVLLDEFVDGLQKDSNAKQFGSLPPLNDVLHQITIPFSIYEISCKKLWMSLPMNLLQLAFVAFSEIYKTQRENHYPRDFLQVFLTDCVQLPLFDLRKLHRKSGHQPSDRFEGQILMGPMLPISFLLELQHKVEMQTGLGGESAPLGEVEIQDQCQFIKNAMENLKHCDLVPTFQSSCSVSLADDNDTWFSQQDSQEGKYFLFHEPSCNLSEEKEHISLKNGSFIDASEEEDPILKNQMSASCKSKRIHDKFIGSKYHDFPPNNAGERPLISEFYDDICPVSVVSVTSGAEIDYEADVLEALKNMKREFHIWQQSYQLYQVYLGANVYRSPYCF